MKTLLFMLCCSWLAFAAEWNLIGTANVKVNNYLSTPEVLCTDEGLYLRNKNFTWDFYPSGLPALDAYQYSADTLLVILSNGSWSDGLYSFSYSTGIFKPVFYCGFPRFIYYVNGPSFYFLGTSQGIFTSPDGFTWNTYPHLNGLDCYSMDSYYDGEYASYAVATSGGIYFHIPIFSSILSKGDTSLSISQINFDYQGNLYGIVKGESDSSGLWVSRDIGRTWENVFYQHNLSGASFNRGVIVGWDKPDPIYGSVALWDSSHSQLYSLQGNLPLAKVNRFSVNDILNCINVVCCTDSGAYISCNLSPSEVSDDKVLQPAFPWLFQNYPNPFNSSTTINFIIDKREHVNLTVTDILGREVARLADEIKDAGSYSVSLNSNTLTSGIYFYTLKAGQYNKSKKLILLK